MADTKINTQTALKYQDFDFSEAMAIANPTNSATLTLLLNNGRNMKPATSTLIQGNYKELSKGATSGGKAEGAAFGAAEKTKRIAVENATEIFSKNVEISGTMLALNATSFEDELADRISEIKEDINGAIINGILSKTDPRKMAGLSSIAKLVGNVIEPEPKEPGMGGAGPGMPSTPDANGLVETNNYDVVIDQALQKLTTRGNVYLAVPAANKFLLQRVLGDYSALPVSDRMESVSGLNVVQYVSPQGIAVNLYTENKLAKNNFVLYDIDAVDYKELRPLSVKPIAMSADSESAAVVTEATIMANPSSIVCFKMEYTIPPKPVTPPAEGGGEVTPPVQ